MARPSVNELFKKSAGSGVTVEADPIALEAVEKLTEVVDKLPTTDITDALKQQIEGLDTKKADKTKVDSLNTAIEELTAAMAAGASEEELAAAVKKVNDAIAAVELSIRKLIGNTVYTALTTVQAAGGDSVYITEGGTGDIQLEAAPEDGKEIKILDPLKLIKAGKNNIIPGTGDYIGQGQGAAVGDESPLSFSIDNELRGGFLRLKYRSPAKTWDVFVDAPIPPASGSGGGELATAVLSILPAKQWTNWPLLTQDKAGKEITLERIDSSNGEDWTSRFELRRGSKQIYSLSEHKNLQFTYEVH